MEAKELRIGNLVQDENYAWFRVTSEDFLGVNEDGTLPFRPIQLSEDWLLMFGFSKQNSYYFKDSDYRIATILNHFAFSVGNDNDGIVLTGLYFVHQLQNLYFALTGTELIALS